MSTDVDDGKVSTDLVIPPLRLSYLPFQAMAETTRFLLRHGNIPYTDEIVWGKVFSTRRAQGEYPFDKVPVMYINGTVVAQSGSIARYAAKLSGCYPEDPAACALNDAAFEMAQELCTINPMINCYTGKQFDEIKAWYFRELPFHLSNLEFEWLECTREGKLDFFGGSTPSHADFNVYHHLANARLVEPECVSKHEGLTRWMSTMEALPSLRAYLDERPELVGIGKDPGLKDKNGRVIRQRDPEGRAIIKDGVFVFGDDIDETTVN
jgi:glutathione S-transferase